MNRPTPILSLSAIALCFTACGGDEKPAAAAKATPSPAPALVAKVGESLTYRDEFTLNDADNDVDAEVTVVSVQIVKNVPASTKLTYPLKSGRVWVRARVQVKSLADTTFQFPNSDFELIDSADERIREEGSDVFKPALMYPRLIKGDTVKGYIAFQMPADHEPAEIRLASQVNLDNEPRRWRLP
jgi:hypothetical protein